jgi:hypothetical protein
MTAIADRIQKRLQCLPAPQAARLEHLLEELLDLSEAEALETGVAGEAARLEAQGALERMAARGGISDISDPAGWQREIRNDRPLPGREP